MLESRLERYMVAHPNLAIRRADIGKWNNAAAAQATHLGAEALPYIRVYDARGKFVTSVTGGMWDEVLGGDREGRRDEDALVTSLARSRCCFLACLRPRYA